MDKEIKKFRENKNEYVKKVSLKELEDLIIYSNDKYYEGESVLEDDEFDFLKDYIEKKYPSSEIINLIGMKNLPKNKVKLPFYLPSMDKIKTESVKFEKWIKEYGSPYLLTDKLDGISALYYQGKLYTRGSATEGLDISKLIPYLDIPKILDDIAIRGELIMSKKNFKKYEKEFSNARNLVAGIVNQKTLNVKIAKDIDFVIYELIKSNNEFKNQLEIFKYLEKNKFNLVNYQIVNEINFDFLLDYLKKRREISPYLIDGIIISNLQIHKRPTSGNPKYAFAFKANLDDQQAQTKVIDIEWNVSKDGYLKPTIIIEETIIGGVKINRVTGNNAKFIIDNNIGKDTIILLIRSGDVIPKVEQVLSSTKPILPKISYQWNETKVDFITIDKTSDQEIKEMVHFVKQLEIKNVGIGIIKKLYQNNINDIIKLIKITKDDLDIDGLKEKSINKIYQSIKDKLENITLEELMNASNIFGHGLGLEKLKLINKNINLMEIINNKKFNKKELIDKIKEIDGFSDKSTNLFVDNLNQFIKFYHKIKNHIKIIKPKKIINKSNSKINNKNILITGFRDKDLENIIIQNNANLLSSFSKNIDILIIKDETIDNNKTQKAIELNIEIITKNDFIKKYL